MSYSSLLTMPVTAPSFKHQQKAYEFALSRFGLLESRVHSNSIKQKPFFVGWKYINRNGSQTKTPVNPHTGANAKSNDPSTWGTYEQVKAAVEKYHLEGPGIMFAKENGIVGIDIDHCYNPKEKQFNETASSILRCFLCLSLFLYL